MKCCCHALGEQCPLTGFDAEHVHRCRPRALDMGHCGPEDVEKSWCCGGVSDR